jgi:hypothetical protein
MMAKEKTIPELICKAASLLPDPSKGQVGDVCVRKAHDPSATDVKVPIDFVLEATAENHPATYRWRTETVVGVTPNVYIDECVGLENYLREALGPRCERVDINNLDTTSDEEHVVTLKAYFK